MSNLIINMFGDFTIQAEDKSISGDDNRAKKLWLLMAYLIYNRHRVVKQSELIDVLWSEYEKGSNPAGALKTFAIQAGREIRILVKPDEVSDRDMINIAREIVKKIEAELKYPGQIKVHVVRESRVVDYAK